MPQGASAHCDKTREATISYAATEIPAVGFNEINPFVDGRIKVSLLNGKGGINLYPKLLKFCCS